MIRRHTLLSVVLLTVGCLPSNPGTAAPVRDAAPNDTTPTPMPPLTLLIAEFQDLAGNTRALSHIPRTPKIVLHFSYALPNDAPPLWLLRGEPDTELQQDLQAPPLDRNQQARIVAVDIATIANQTSLQPSAPLTPGATYTLAIGRWLQSREGIALDEPVTLAFEIATTPDTGAAVTHSWPADGASAVGRNLHAAYVRFDGWINDNAAPIHITRSDRNGRAVFIDSTYQTVPCHALGWTNGTCLRISPRNELEALTEYSLVVNPSLRDHTGASIPPWRARFETTERDTEAPTLLPMRCGLDEQELVHACVRSDDESIHLRFRTQEPTRAQIASTTWQSHAFGPRGEYEVSIETLPSSQTWSTTLTLWDTAGLSRMYTLPLHTEAPLATVTIDELLPNPNGREPTQEYIELWNYGTAPVLLQGMSLADQNDRIGDVIADAYTLEPGQRALLVAQGYLLDTGFDTPIPPGVALIRLDNALGSGGIRNSGEPVFLRDAAGRRLSTVPAILSPPGGSCYYRQAGSRRRGRRGDFAVDPSGECTPGRPTRDE